MIELTQEELKQHFSEPIFGQIAETADTLGMECYVVGGYVRDIFLRRLSMMKTDSVQDSPIFTNGALKIDYAAGCAYIDGAELHLTPIEYKLLCLLSKNVGKVLTHTYITQQIWGSSWENDIASLRVFMATLRKKLENGKDGQQYIQTHIGIGYRMLRVE